AERTQAVQRTERRAERPQRIERAQVDRQDRIQRVQADRQDRVGSQAVANRVDRRVDRRTDRAVIRVEGRLADRAQVRADRIDRIDSGVAVRVDDRIDRARDRVQVRNSALARRVAAFKDASTTFEIAPRARNRALING
ncbi:MAG: hypothetical protein ABIS39_01795, partial [Sphingomicrobium sp.]